MTVGTRENGKAAKKASCNNYAHICVPMVPEGSAWKQVDHSIMAKTCAKGYAPLLLDSAMLVCQYGGLIRIVEVPQTGTSKEPVKEYVSAEQLIAIGWSKDVVTPEMVKELNRVLEAYGITDINSIRHFIAQASHESDDWYKTGYGDGLIEIGSKEYLQGQKYWPYIGAGYIHLTWEYNYQKFSDYLRKEKSIDDLLIMSEGPNRIASTYAWESAAYFWSVFTNANEVASHPDVQPDKLSEIVNKYDKASFPVRADIYYNKVVTNIK
ncbi:hypothetical protein LBYZC6_38320 [Lacrimispora brassicae]